MNEHPEMFEQEARKARSIAILRSEGVPYIEHLPAIEAED
jgi:hypothetical protein